MFEFLMMEKFVLRGKAFFLVIQMSNDDVFTDIAFLENGDLGRLDDDGYLYAICQKRNHCFIKWQKLML